MISVVVDETLRYPDGEDFYSPDEQFPEYQHDHISTRPNHVYRAVRACFAQAGLDRTRFGHADWNPLGEFIQPGNRVFALCNFVLHREPGQGIRELWAKCTHGSVLRALLDYVLLALGRAGSVRFGNAPVQACHWEEVLHESGAATVLDFYGRRGLDVQARDLRLFVTERDRLRRTRRTVTRDQPLNAVEIELGKNSLLSELYQNAGGKPRFRVAEYDPSKTEACHSAKSHKYILNREILNSDVVISVPKLKTHSKVGMTCALKGFVGTVGHKDCLAHHRFGGPQKGGDEYPGESWIRVGLSHLHGWVYGHESGLSKWLLQATDAISRYLLNRMGAIQEGGWHGNDTAWRMALDVARIAAYAGANGLMEDVPQRKHLVFVDGIIGGGGDGPLSPQPVQAGVVLFGDDVVLGDWVCAKLMGFDPEKIPLVREAFRVRSFPLSDARRLEQMICVNGKGLLPGGKDILGPAHFIPPRGWKGHIEGV